MAAAEAIEELSGRQTQIKWVNDVLIDDKKVCGILTEAAMDCESGQLQYAIIGIGFNLTEPEGGFPPELRGIAGAVFPHTPPVAARAKLAAAVLDRLTDYCAAPGNPLCLEAYRARSFVVGKDINILRPEREPIPATALAIEPDYALRVRLTGGEVQRLTSGEVSIRVTA